MSLMDDIRAEIARGHRGDKAAVPASVWGWQLLQLQRLPSEWERDAGYALCLGWQFTYYPDGHKSIDFPRGSVHLPIYP